LKGTAKHGTAPLVGSAKLVLGVLLAGLGVILLAGHLGYLPSGTGGWMLQYWPAILILIGLGLLASSLRSVLLGWIATVLVIAALAFGAWWVHQHGTGSRPEIAKTYDLNRPRAETLTVRARVFGGSLSLEPNLTARAGRLDVIATGTQSDEAAFTTSGGVAILDWPTEDGRVYQAPLGGNVRLLVPLRFRVRFLTKSLFSQVRASLARLRPERCEVEAIASSVRIDANGPARPSLVLIRGTLANVELSLPANCPARLEFEAPLTFRSLPDDFVEHAVGKSKTKIWTSDGSGPAVLVRVAGPLIHLKIRREPVRAL
jgi:hypothetical protein